MSGWKTLTAGILTIVYGVVGFISGIHDIETAIQFVLGGLAILGIGHKIEKTSTKK